MPKEDLKQELADLVKTMNFLLAEKRTIENLKKLRALQRDKVALISRMEARSGYGN